MLKFLPWFLLFNSIILQGYSQKSRLQIHALQKGIYIHTSFKDLEGEPFPSNGMIIEGDKSVIIVDSPWDIPQTQTLLRWISRNINKPVSHCIVTHSHDDRVAGTRIMQKKNIKIMALQLTAEKMLANGYPRPDIILPFDSTLHTDGLIVETFFPGPGHSSDNLVVWLPERKVLFGGCFIKSVQAFGLGNIADANLQEWPHSLARVKEKFATPEIVIPGHQGWETPSSPQYTLELLKQKDAKGN